MALLLFGLFVIATALTFPAALLRVFGIIRLSWHVILLPFYLMLAGLVAMFVCYVGIVVLFLILGMIAK